MAEVQGWPGCCVMPPLDGSPMTTEQVDQKVVDGLDWISPSGLYPGPSWLQIQSRGLSL